MRSLVGFALVALLSAAKAQNSPGKGDWKFTCKVTGDPHYRTFDGFYYNHMSAYCEQILVQNCTNNEATLPLTITGKNSRGDLADVSYLADLRVKIHNMEIEFKAPDRSVDAQENRGMTINGQPVQVYPNKICYPEEQETPYFCVFAQSEKTVVFSENEFQITIDNTKKYKSNPYLDAWINLAAAMKGKVCGMCGDANEDRDNDEKIVTMFTGEGGGIAKGFLDAAKVGKSCVETEVPVDPVKCPEEFEVTAEKQCGVIRQNINCVNEFSEKELELEFHNCVMDVCAATERTACDSIRAFITSCEPQDDDRRRIQEETGCVLKCEDGSNKELDSCGSPCQKQCNKNLENECPESSSCLEVCVCKEGYILDGDVCVKEDECGCNHGGEYFPTGATRFNEDCSKQFECYGGDTWEEMESSCNLTTSDCVDDVSREGHKVCDCKTGYYKPEDSKQCIDDDECGESDCDPVKSECKNTLGSFECVCKEGYVKDEDSHECGCEEGYIQQSDGTCNDCDECAGECLAEGQTSCCVGSQECENVPGGFKCYCPEGYVECDEGCCDRNECDDNNGGCIENEICENTDGSFRCVPECPETQILDPEEFICIDRNECDTHYGGCDNNTQVCRNLDPGFECECAENYEDDGSGGCREKCPDGYQRAPGGGECQDCNECDNQCVSEPVCEGDLECVNNAGSYDCKCPEGYERDEEDPTKCPDINECAADEDPCKENQECENQEGGFHCADKCPEGTVRNANGECVDINECDSDMHGCDLETEDCENTDGSYECHCKDGFEEDANGNCVETCPPGYTRTEEGVCEDDDECKHVGDLCQGKYFTCVNMPGNYSCECIEGFSQVGDECTKKCPLGYESDDDDCKDIDECDDDNDEIKHVCAEHMDCENTDGSFICTCQSGYIMSDTDVCVEITTTANPDCTERCDFLNLLNCQEGVDAEELKTDCGLALESIGCNPEDYCEQFETYADMCGPSEFNADEINEFTSCHFERPDIPPIPIHEMTTTEEVLEPELGTTTGYDSATEKEVECQRFCTMIFEGGCTAIDEEESQTREHGCKLSMESDQCGSVCDELETYINLCRPDSIDLSYINEESGCEVAEPLPPVTPPPIETEPVTEPVVYPDLTTIPPTVPPVDGEEVVDNNEFFLSDSGSKRWNGKNRSSQLATDGLLGEKNKDCYHSREDGTLQWMKYRFKKPHNFGDVRFYNRFHNPDRIKGYYIEVCEDDCNPGEGQECNKVSETNASTWVTTSCGGINGKVMVISNKDNLKVPIHLCEVQVYKKTGDQDEGMWIDNTWHKKPDNEIPANSGGDAVNYDSDELGSIGVLEEDAKSVFEELNQALR